ncbi:DEAD/DEAH box helicase [Deinococcus peraridilitoris]|uniref:Transcription-repair-coupling factor n=1 Tax=Deinococcus peraridilitoris (strain DSM 19664 / LMG 22246 / CIP 109416 / KR-200) TaxID=937777 RepID=K9ZY47_DEIPD|nr:DEAD/DEAH box helicase [Deinococcus peraridilitoris]AFZ65857.1 transcription-repair coupling factor (superfamily II helicase) [Deinococcus peraridilitoris DSM 19664]
MTSATQPLNALVPQVTTGTFLMLPQVARAALFSAHRGPAVLLTTPERAELYASAGALGAPVGLNPGLREWGARPQHVVLDVVTALDLFPRDPDAHALDFRLGASYPRQELLAKLERLGYERDEDTGYVLRGDSVELRPVSGPRVRAEFFGDELDTLRELDENGQPGSRLDRFVLPPAEGYLSDVKWDATRLELLPGRIFLDSPEFYGSALGPQLETLWALLAGREITSFGRAPLELPDGTLPIRTLPFYRAKLSEFASDVDRWKAQGYRVLMLVRHDRTAAYLTEKLLQGAEPKWLSTPRVREGELGFLRAMGEGGFEVPDEKIVVLTEDLVYGFQGGSALRGKKLSGKPVADALGLQVGDYLIHPEHGIGEFKGLETRTVLGVARDYLHLEYKNSAKLYLPIELLPILRRHPGTTDDPPNLSSLDKKDWSKARERARKSAEELAARLLVQYAARQITPGTAFMPIPEWDAMIEQNFQFELTEDQVTALRDTFKDLEASYPMDRLIAGDVGFGKTEVALRAAHRVVGHGKQVAILVPTTLLAEQHTATFHARFKDLPVRVEGLSRFTPAKQESAILKDLAAGKVDIVIGTHRLLSQDIRFKDLGMIVVDEEHRFGVVQKEKLKALRGLPEASRPEKETTKNSRLEIPEGSVAVDMLSLSATPIPRTLYMSMVGLRDMSAIQTPPKGRKPIRTVLAPYEPMTIRDAIVSEIERGGKVFYIHDRVASIGSRSLYLRNLVPEARVGVAHGQMPEEALEEIMMGFEEGAFDVLLATTIVETGLDIPEANTILIERADRLGLAQLYQLRGRVGRRAQEAYAYMFYPPRITENASRRLFAIADLQDLGSGHKLAEKDMEIRGVGNILGEEQHGHVQAVSIEVYTELLAEAVAKLKGETLTVPESVSIDLPVNARLTPEYFGSEDDRIAFYGRLSEARTLPALSRIERDMRKRFGVPTPEVQNFLDLAKLRLTAVARRVLSIGDSMTHLQVTFAYKALDYDAAGLRNFPHKTEVVPFPPSVRLEKRGLKPDDYPHLLIELLGYFG